VIKSNALVPVNNQLPAANPDSAAIATGVLITINVLANGTDPDGAIVPETVTIAIGVKGTTTETNTGTFSLQGQNSAIAQNATNRVSVGSSLGGDLAIK